MEMKKQYTFDSFVVGKSNSLAFTAAKAIVDRPTEYNPLFIRGGTGTGKTHLLYAIKNAVCSQRGEEAVSFFTGDEMLAMFVHSLRERRYDDFQRRLNSSTYLLLDDLHTLICKTATQEKFANLFCHAVTQGQQIVLTSSTQPAELPVLEDSLRNDFSRCLIADIQPLDYETCKEIVFCKLSQSGTRLSEDEINQIVTNSNGEARYIERSINMMAVEKSLQDIG